MPKPNRQNFQEIVQAPRISNAGHSVDMHWAITEPQSGAFEGQEIWKLIQMTDTDYFVIISRETPLRQRYRLHLVKWRSHSSGGAIWFGNYVEITLDRGDTIISAVGGTVDPTSLDSKGGLLHILSLNTVRTFFIDPTNSSPFIYRDSFSHPSRILAGGVDLKDTNSLTIVISDGNKIHYRWSQPMQRMEFVDAWPILTCAYSKSIFMCKVIDYEKVISIFESWQNMEPPDHGFNVRLCKFTKGSIINGTCCGVIHGEHGDNFWPIHRSLIWKAVGSWCNPEIFIFVAGELSYISLYAHLDPNSGFAQKIHFKSNNGQIQESIFFGGCSDWDIGLWAIPYDSTLRLVRAGPNSLIVDKLKINFDSNLNNTDGSIFSFVSNRAISTPNNARFVRVMWRNVFPASGFIGITQLGQIFTSNKPETDF